MKREKKDHSRNPVKHNGYYFLFKTNISFHVESSVSEPFKVFIPSLITYVGLELGFFAF